MEKYLILIIETVAIIIAYFVGKTLINRAAKKVAKKSDKSETRVIILRKSVNFILGIIAFILVVMIWGVKQSDLAVFVTSILAVIGIAFFAQWSIISNITATFIIFFNHPAKIGDKIEVYDKDYPIKGRILDLGVFFITIETDEEEIITIPSNVFIQKMVVKK